MARPDSTAETRRAEGTGAAHYYAREQPGLDLRFIVCVENAIEVILEDPLRWRPFDEDVRRCLTRVFPYGILYTIEPDLYTYRRRCPLQPRTRLLEAPNRL